MPPYLRVTELSACTNGLEDRFELFGRDADAGVADLELEHAAARRRRATWPRRTTLPSSVNLIALLTRFIKSCLRRCGSD